MLLTDRQTDRQTNKWNGNLEIANLPKFHRMLPYCWTNVIHPNTGKRLGTKQNANGMEKGGECVIGFASEIYSLYWIASIFHSPNGCITLHLSWKFRVDRSISLWTTCNESSDFVLRLAVVIYIESTPFSNRIWPDVAPICGPNSVANSPLVFR